MAKTYLDILTKRGIDLFLSEENLESLRKFDPRAEYAVPGQAAPVFRSPKQHQIEVGKKLQPDCRYVLVWGKRGGAGAGGQARHGGSRRGQAPSELEMVG